MKSDALDGMVVFAAVAESKNFRLAGERLGVSASAVSQSLRKLEERLGVPLVHRTTRSVRLSQAGERVYASVRPALEGRGLRRGHPARRVIDRDMIAVPVTGDIRMTVVGAPAYFARHRKPRHPRDLVEHDCLNWHPAAGAPAYRWEFTEDGREVVVAVRSRVLSTDSAVNIRLARAGLGLTILYEDQVRDEIARGELVPVLERSCEPFPGYYLFYPQRRHASPALRVLIDHLRAARARTRSGHRRVSAR